MAEFASSFIRKRRNRSSASLEREKSVSSEVTSNDNSACDHKDEVMEALDKIGAIGKQLNTILDRLNKLDVIEISIKNIEKNPREP